MAVSNPGLSLLSHFNRNGPLHIPVENAICKSHFWPPALDNLNGKAVKTCGMLEGAMLVLGPCVSWVCQRDSELSHRAPSEKLPDHFIFLIRYRMSPLYQCFSIFPWKVIIILKKSRTKHKKDKERNGKKTNTLGININNLLSSKIKIIIYLILIYEKINQKTIDWINKNYWLKLIVKKRKRTLVRS